MRIKNSKKYQIQKYALGPWWTPLAIAGASLAVNLLIWVTARVFGSPTLAEFEPLAGPGSVIILTILGAFGAYFVYWFITQITSNSSQVFIIVSIIVLLISLIPDIDYPANSPGYSIEAIVILMSFHFSSAIVNVGLLLWLVQKYKN